jgi:hypothetical protein
VRSEVTQGTDVDDYSNWNRVSIVAFVIFSHSFLDGLGVKTIKSLRRVFI